MSLRERLFHLIADTIEQFEGRYAPGFHLPPTFGGHLVGTDAVADVAYTLGWFGPGAGTVVAGVPLDEALRTVLSQIDGAATHSFFSYRVAETLARFGPFDDNRLLAEMAPAQVDNLRLACDSTELLPLLDGLLPRNYLAVLARCERARERLGILDDPAVLDDLVDRTRDLLTANPEGFLDESHEGAGRFDIYAADIYLFCEPLADLLGDVWERGIRTVLDLIDVLATTEGASITWGRSTGVLSEALTIELAALALRRGIGDAGTWLGHAERAIESAERWFADGITTAYLGRSPEDYRGPQRRLQLTFDLLGKLGYAMAALDGAPDVTSAALTDHDELRRFSDRAAVWSHRSPTLPFALPFVSGRSSDYLPAPHHPGLFETPVDSANACWVPVVHAHGGPLEPQRRYAPGEVPAALTHEPGRVDVTHDGFVVAHPVDGAHPKPDRIGATRRATYEVVDGGLHVTERLAFDDAPIALSILVPSTARRPLRVDADGPVVVHTVDVDGMKEWQTAWGAISTVTEIEIEPATAVDLTWSATPKSRVALTSPDAGYVRTVYDPISDRLHGRIVEQAWTSARDATDVAHIHWPEWCFGYGTTVEEHARIAAKLRRQGTRIVWTQHNLTPHLDEPDVYDPIYQVWAEATDLAIHHSHWGMEQVVARYRFRDECRHEVIPHPHFGPAMTPAAEMSRDEAAERLGLRHGADAPAIRIGVIGAPRKQKDLALVVDAVRAAGRDDVELVVWSLSFTDSFEPDPRIVTHVYDNVDRDVYDLRLAACDAIALPFTDHTMLGTGTTSDLVAAGTPGLMTDWPYLVEHLDGLGITMGATVESWTDGIRSLDRAHLDAAAAHAEELRDRYAPARVGAATAAAIEALGVQRV